MNSGNAQVIHTVSELVSLIQTAKRSGKTIGFVPTMGALHDGHLSLMRASKAENDITVCSIYVNPTQFDNKDDLAKYPKTLDVDVALLNTVGVELVFAPSDTEMYPDGMDYVINVDLDEVDKVLEGAHRPGHFEGVVQIVHRLLEVVQPHHLYMGQKDFQQFTIIQKMIDNLEMPIELVVCPIAREDHGLARSSRNERLSAEDRGRACIIYHTLNEMKDDIHHLSIDNLLTRAELRLSWSWTELEYVDIINGNTLTSVSKVDDQDYLVAVVAVWIGGVRLIDNLILYKN